MKIIGFVGFGSYTLSLQTMLSSLLISIIESFVES